MNWIPIVKLGAWCVVIATGFAYLIIIGTIILALAGKQKASYALKYDLKAQLGYLLFGLCLGILLYL